MPTPFMHLHLVQKVRARLRPPIPAWLETQWPAFYLGNIAPDFQSICHLPREETHFYPIPPQKGDYGAFERLLKRYPSLFEAGQQTPDLVAFLAGYAIHLQFDLWWDHQLLTPCFRDGNWLDLYGRFTAHNILLTLLDQEARSALVPLTRDILEKAVLKANLPFDPDDYLTAWQRAIGEQLAPGAPSQTVAIYARRMRMTPRSFQKKLHDQAWLDQNIYRRVSPNQIEEILEAAVEQSLELIKKHDD